MSMTTASQICPAVQVLAPQVQTPALHVPVPVQSASPSQAHSPPTHMKPFPQEFGAASHWQPMPGLHDGYCASAHASPVRLESTPQVQPSPAVQTSPTPQAAPAAAQMHPTAGLQSGFVVPVHA